MAKTKKGHGNGVYDTVKLQKVIYDVIENTSSTLRHKISIFKPLP